MKARIAASALLFLLLAGGAQAKHKDLVAHGVAKIVTTAPKAASGTAKVSYKIFRFII